MEESMTEEQRQRAEEEEVLKKMAASQFAKGKAEAVAALVEKVQKKRKRKDDAEKELKQAEDELARWAL